MIEAHLKGLSEDGSHLRLTLEDGGEIRLAVTDELKAAMRHARVTRANEERASTTLSPREIQQRIRAGLNAAELAQLTGEPVEALAKFEAPVLAERAYIVELARGSRAGKTAGTLTLGELVDDRLVARGAEAGATRWDAWRELDEPWHVAVDFVAGGRNCRAVWAFDHAAKTLKAIDDESVWLTETELLDAPIPKRHLAAVRAAERSAPSQAPARLAAAEEPATASGGDEETATVTAIEQEDPTEALLAELAARRGVRESVAPPSEDDDDEAGDEVFEGFGPAARARAQAAESAAPAASTAPQSPTTTPVPVAPGERRSRRGRASVPSWDDIVFGSKGE